MAATDMGKTWGGPVMSQRNLIYIVGAIIVVVVIYFLFLRT